MPWAVAGTCTGASREEAWLLPESQGRFLLPVAWPCQLSGGTASWDRSSTAIKSPFGFCSQRSVLISDQGAGGRTKEWAHRACGRTQGRSRATFALRTGGPFEFPIITQFPLLNRGPVPGLQLPGRRGRGQLSPMVLFVRGDVSCQSCPSPGCIPLYSGVC